MSTSSAADAAWEAFRRPGMGDADELAFRAGFAAAAPELEFAWREGEEHYWPYSLRDDEEGETLEAATAAATEEWFDASDSLRLHARSKAVPPGAWFPAVMPALAHRA